jgi:hypothetical protein
MKTSCGFKTRAPGRTRLEESGFLASSNRPPEKVLPADDPLPARKSLTPKKEKKADFSCGEECERIRTAEEKIFARAG